MLCLYCRVRAFSEGGGNVFGGPSFLIFVFALHWFLVRKEGMKKRKEITREETNSVARRSISLRFLSSPRKTSDINPEP